MSKLDAIVNKINKDAGSNIITDGIVYEELPRIPFSSPRLNYMTHGGLPRGYMSEFFGDENGGKTTTALDIVANFQKISKKEFEQQKEQLEAIKNPNKTQKQQYAQLVDSGHQKCVYMDIECTLDKEWAKKLGVDVDDLLIFTPEEQSAEFTFQTALEMCETGEVGLVVIDSIGALFSEAEGTKSIGEATYCGIAGPLTKFSKKIVRLSRKYGITVIAINQVRDDLDATYGPRKRTTGGKAFKHQCATRIQFMKGEYLDAKNQKIPSNCESPAGNIIKVHIAKTKKFPFDRKEGFYTLNYEKGIDKISDLIEVCKLKGVIAQNGAYYSILETNGDIMQDDEGNDVKFQGKAALAEFINNTEVIYNYLTECLEKL